MNKGLVALGAGAGLLGLVLIATRSSGQNPPPGMANLFGTVREAVSNMAIQGAVISLGGLQAVTGSDGFFLINGIEPGSYDVMVEIAGYWPVYL